MDLFFHTKNEIKKVNKKSEWKILCSGAIPIDNYFEKVGYPDIFFNLHPKIKREIEKEIKKYVKKDKNINDLSITQKIEEFTEDVLEHKVELTDEFHYTYSIHIPFQHNHYLGKVSPFFIQNIVDLDEKTYIVSKIKHKYTHEWKEKMLETYYLQYDMKGGVFSSILVIPTHGVVLV